MKLFFVKANGSYCGGAAVVIAKDKDHAAVLLYGKTQGSYFNVHWGVANFTELPFSCRGKTAGVLEVFETGE